jgi:anti-anti-sigma regulatory factor
MLRITKTFEDDSTIAVRLDGKIISATVAELEEACRDYCNGGGQALFLDFSGVTFIDDEGLGMLKKIKRRGIAMVNGSPFVETLLSGLGK